MKISVINQYSHLANLVSFFYERRRLILFLINVSIAREEVSEVWSTIPGREIFRLSLINRLDDMLRTENRTANLIIGFDSSTSIPVLTFALLSLCSDPLYDSPSHCIFYSARTIESRFQQIGSSVKLSFLRKILNMVAGENILNHDVVNLKDVSLNVFKLPELLQ